MYLRIVEDSFALEVNGEVLEAVEGYDGVEFKKCAGELKAASFGDGYYVSNRGAEVPITQDEINTLLATAILSLHKRLSKGM